MNLALVAIVFWFVALAVIWLFIIGSDDRDEHDSHRGEIEPPTPLNPTAREPGKEK